jgi:hypothetical protein
MPGGKHGAVGGPEWSVYDAVVERLPDAALLYSGDRLLHANPDGDRPCSPARGALNPFILDGDEVSLRDLAELPPIVEPRPPIKAPPLPGPTH